MCTILARGGGGGDCGENKIFSTWGPQSIIALFQFLLYSSLWGVRTSFDNQRAKIYHIYKNFSNTERTGDHRTKLSGEEKIGRKRKYKEEECSEETMELYYSSNKGAQD